MVSFSAFVCACYFNTQHLANQFKLLRVISLPSMLDLTCQPWCQQFSFGGDRTGKPRSCSISEHYSITSMPLDESMIDIILVPLGWLCGLIASGHPAIHLDEDTFASRLAAHASEKGITFVSLRTSLTHRSNPNLS
jgi:hypothetical protein